MKKKLTDYVGYYVGAPIHVKAFGQGINAGPWYPVEKLDEGIIRCGGIQVILDTLGEGYISFDFPPSHCKLILRRASDMSEQEKQAYDQIEPSAEQTRWLLLHHFDAFGLIEAGVARDAATYCYHRRPLKSILPIGATIAV